jgi:hypothetical protein
MTTPHERVAESFISAGEELRRFQERSEAHRRRRYYPFVQKAAEEEERNQKLVMEFERRGLAAMTGLPVGAPLKDVNDALEKILEARGPEEPIKEAQAARGGVWGLAGMPAMMTLKGAVAPLGERYQEKFIEPSAASWTGLAQKFIPGQQEIERTADELVKAGVPPADAIALAYQMSDLATGVKGAIELAADPFMWTAAPGVARGAVGAARLGAKGARAVGQAAKVGAKRLAELPVPAARESLEALWNRASVPARATLAKEAGLEGKVGSKAWTALTDAEKRVLEQSAVRAEAAQVAKPVEAARAAEAVPKVGTPEYVEYWAAKPEAEQAAELARRGIQPEQISEGMPFGPQVAVGGEVPPVVPPAAEAAAAIPPAAIPPAESLEPIIPEGTARAITIAEEKVRQAAPGLVSRAFDAFPVTRPIYRFFVPARALSEAQHVAWVAKSAAVSEYQTLAFAARSKALRALDEAFGPAFKTGAKADVAYVGPAERAQSRLIGTTVDVLPNPEYYALSQAQRQAIAQARTYENTFLDMAVNEYGAKIGRFPTKEGAAFVPNVDVSESALEITGNVYTAARVGRAKTRVWQDAISRQMHDPSFKPEMNLEVLFGGADQAKATLIASEVFKTRLGGLTKLEVLQKTHPKLATKMTALRKRLVSLKGSAGRLETRVQTAVDEFLASPIDDIDLVTLRDSLDVKLARGPRAGMDVAALQKEISQVRTQIKGLQPYWKAANLKPYVFVKEGVFRYFPVTEAKSLRQLLEVSTNPALSLAWEVRNIAFNLDLSPITGVHLPLGFLADPLGTARQLVRGTRTAVQRRSFLEAVKPSALVDDIARDPVSWGEFAAVSGRPVGATAKEFAGGIINRIPRYTRANEAMFTLVTRRTKAMFDDLVRGAEKAGIPHNEAVVAASEAVHQAIPLIDHALLGQSAARAKLLQSVTISPSFLLRPPQLMAQAAKALVKAGLRQPLTLQEKMALRVALTMGATIETISVTSAAIDAWAHDRDPRKAAIDALGDMSLHLFNGRKIPLGGPYRSLVNALKPQWINREMDYMMPFAGVGRWALGKMTPALRTQYDLIRNKDFFGRRIMTGDFPVNILQAVAYEFEGAVPLSISAWIEGKRTGASIEKTAEESATQALGTSLYERPGPWSMRTEWRDEIRDYLAIPSNALERKAAGITTTREVYRKRHPDVDAKLFITGYVSTVSTDAAGGIVEQLLQENNLDPSRISGVEAEEEARAEYERLGVKDTRNTPTTRLVNRLDIAKKPEAPIVPQTPVQLSVPVPVQRWNAVSERLDTRLLQALVRVWYQSGKLTEEEEVRLRDIHKDYSFGQPNFNTWLKQTLRQTHELAAWMQPGMLNLPETGMPQRAATR